MGRLFDLIQAHVDAQPYEVPLAHVAKKIGVSRQTLLNWREPSRLIAKDHLLGISRVTGVPYQRVLDALLDDIGYLQPDDPPAGGPTSLSERRPTVPDDELADLPSVAHTPRRPRSEEDN